MKERVKHTFIKYTSMDCESLNEREIADALISELEELGFTVEEDDAGAKIGGNAGNLYAYKKGNKDAQPVLFAAHMDTVKPGIGKSPQLTSEGKFLSSGNTVLGGDDVCGITAILEGIRQVIIEQRKHGDIEVVFFVAEELHCKGSSEFDFSKIHAKMGYVLDLEGAPGMAAVQAPTSTGFWVTVEGKAAHAGFCPEKGINAIAIAAEAITKITQGRIDPETTRNIGKIEGGVATNIVSESCTCTGEIRSLKYEKVQTGLEQVRRIFEQTATQHNAKIHMKVHENYRGYQLGKEEAVVKRFQRACYKLHKEAQVVTTFGGSDNNKLMQHGVKGIVLSCGMQNVHSVKEYANLEDVVDTARLVAELVSTQSEYKLRLS
ncbi:M20/M25/M40 family metallo-hydrolase [Eubacterium oxidoreducens]|uniref:Peptidase T-like protein n=1 Tax=Eubacterium oxidoreducens TaxID=1732 RepID=A0A1G6BDF4_EUBOX|nr:M20/M25/M40 family metallo-hydrolase [Eubacterium oxidoreducens]SDB18579.1 peptidase T-like protein [Eubacterium oxidoreducens]